MLFSAILKNADRPSHRGIRNRFWAGQERWDRILSVVLVLAILSAVATVVYMVVVPPVGERDTDFYILGLEGLAEDYPGKLALGDSGVVTLGIVNREHETTIYRVETAINGEKTAEFGPITLNDGEKWEREVSFTPTRVGLEQKVEFLLYKEGQTGVYRSVYLKVDVGG